MKNKEIIYLKNNIAQLYFIIDRAEEFSHLT